MSTRFPSARRIGVVALAFAGSLAGVAPVGAAEPAAAVPPAPAAEAPRTAAAAAPALRSVFAAPAVSARQLGKARGGNASSDTNGSVRNTSATNVEGAPNVIREGSFANAAGLTTVIQNSGSNVLIQNSTTVHVQFKP